jgi:CPA1 family monovalent cation:H+ antiporter
MLVGKLGTCFATPEEEVISQGNKGEAMYFLSKGDCVVNIQDQKGIDHIAFRLLTEGDHFGEISLIYKCKRSATVVSRNYNTMARLNYSRYRELINEFPKFNRYLKANLFLYNDPRKEFLKKIFKNLSYF